MTWEECYDRALAVVAEMADRAYEDRWHETRDINVIGLDERLAAMNEVFDTLVDLKKEVLDA